MTTRMTVYLNPEGGEDTFVLPFFSLRKSRYEKNGNICVFYYLCENMQL